MSYQLTRHKFPPEKWPYLAVGLRLAELVPTIEADGGGVSTQLHSLITHWVIDQEPHHYWEELIDAVLLSEETVIANQLADHVCVVIHDGKHTLHIIHSLTCLFIIGSVISSRLVPHSTSTTGKH